MRSTDKVGNHPSGRVTLILALVGLMSGPVSLSSLTRGRLVRKNHSNGAQYSVGLILTLIGLMGAATLVLGPARPASAQTPALRANGKIAFTSGRDGNHEIYVMNADGSDRTRLTFDPARDGDPAWSPDGARIAFVKAAPNHSAEIFVMDADGGNQRRLTLSNQFRNYRSPTWSPDGTKIAFSNHIYPGGSLYLMNADGSDLRAIQYEFYDPAWSPDGSKLLGTNDNGLVLVNIDGSNLTKIIQTPSPFDPSTYFMDSEPAWSPDGSKIVFTRAFDCDIADCYSTRLYVVNSDGSNLTTLTHQDNLGGSPAWSPDGRKIALGGYSMGDLYVINPDGSGLTNLTNTNDGFEYSPSWQPLSLPQTVNPLDDAQFFVRQHYLDFLGREPDPEGLAFWTNEIAMCGGEAQCVEVKRVNVSAANFLSIEFQETGYLVYRFYKSSYGDLPLAPVPIRLNEFLPDTQKIGQGVIVRQGDWEQKLESNKQAFALEFVQRSRFVSTYPTSMSSEQFVNALFANAGLAPSPSARTAAINEFTFAASTADLAARARALRRVAENSTLAQQEFNRAFVLMQYFGYLRRNPNDAPDGNFDGYNFWLNKLNNFNGNYIEAEMVRAFLTSIEYRRRFGP